MTREEALSLLRAHIAADRMIAHSLASEAVLKALARHFGEDETVWGLAGLLHDIDIEDVGGDMTVHGKAAVPLLLGNGVPREIVEAIRMHNEIATGEPRIDRFHHALAAGETITGLITACALVLPTKRLADVKALSVLKRMKEKAFAASVNRDVIRECEVIGLPLETFVPLALSAMQDIAADLGFSS